MKLAAKRTPLKRGLSVTPIQSELQGDFGTEEPSHTKHNRIHAIGLNLNLPDGDGTRLARLVRKNHILDPILVIWGNSCIDEPDLKVIGVFICKLQRKLVENDTKGVNGETVCGQAYTLRGARDYQVLEKWASRYPLFVRAVPALANSFPVWTALAHSLTATC